MPFVWSLPTSNPGVQDGSYPGPEHTGVRMALDTNNPLPFGTSASGLGTRERRNQLAI